MYGLESLFCVLAFLCIPNIFKPACAGFFEIAFVRDVGMSVYMCVHPEAIIYIYVILKLYNQLNKFVAFRNIMKLSMHGCSLCNKAHCARNQSNKAMLVP